MSDVEAASYAVLATYRIWLQECPTPNDALLTFDPIAHQDFLLKDRAELLWLGAEHRLALYCVGDEDLGHPHNRYIAGSSIAGGDADRVADVDHLSTKEEAAKGGRNDTCRSEFCLGVKGREGIVDAFSSQLRGFQSCNFLALIFHVDWPVDISIASSISTFWV